MASDSEPIRARGITVNKPALDKKIAFQVLLGPVLLSYNRETNSHGKMRIPQNSENKPQGPGLIFFKDPFRRAYFWGAYVWREICVSKSIGLACSGDEIHHFCFILLCSRKQIPSTLPPGVYIRRGDLTEGFCVTIKGGLIFGGSYTCRGLVSEFYG